MNMRLVLYTTILLLALAGWVFGGSELIDAAALAASVVVMAAGTILYLRGNPRPRAMIGLAGVAAHCGAAMLIAMAMVKRDADAYAAKFIREHACRPPLSALRADAGWQVMGYRAEKRFTVWGADRRLNYQDNGLFRYGFLHDDKREHSFPACTP